MIVDNLIGHELEARSAHASSMALQGMALALQMLAAREMRDREAVIASQRSAVEHLNQATAEFRVLADEMKFSDEVLPVDWTEVAGDITARLTTVGWEVPQQLADVQRIGVHHLEELTSELAEADFSGTNADFLVGQSIIDRIAAVMVGSTALSRAASLVNDPELTGGDSW